MTTATLDAHSRRAPGRATAARATFAAWRRKAGLAASRTATNMAGRVASIRSAALIVTGFGFVDAAAYSIKLVLGLAATGISLWLLEWLSD